MDDGFNGVDGWTRSRLGATWRMVCLRVVPSGQSRAGLKNPGSWFEKKVDAPPRCDCDRLQLVACQICVCLQQRLVWSDAEMPLLS